MPKNGTNIENGLPAGWEWKTLGDIAEYINGSAFKPEDWGKKGLPIIRIQNLNGSQVYNYYNGICQDKYLVKNGDILISWSASLDVYKWDGGNAILNQHIFNTNIFTNKITNEFFFLLIKYSLEEIKSKVHGVGMQHITKAKFEKIPIPLPPLAEQNKIVTVLESTFSKIDKSIALVQENIEKIKQLNASVLDEVFERKNANWKQVTLQNLTTKIGSGSTPTGGHASYKTTGISLIRSLNVHDFGFKNKGLAFIDEEQAKKLNNVEVQENDVLLNITGASVARCSIVPKSILPARVNQHVSILRVKKELILPSFLRYALVSPYYKNQLLFKSGGGATREALSKAMLEKFTIAIPTLKEQSNIVAYFETTQLKNSKLLEYYQTKLLSLQQLKNSVLESAFKGELRKVGVASKQADKFKKIEIMYSSIYANIQDGIKQGEMAIAKDMYLIDRIGGVNTGFLFAQGNWGAFDPEEKELIHTKQYFEKVHYPNSKAFYYAVKDNGKLLEKIPTEIKQPIFEVINLLNQKIFAKYDAKQRPNKKELLATVLKCIEDTQSTDFDIIRTEMKNWKTPKQEFKNKAEKFTPEETQKVLGYILNEGWEKKVIK